MSPPLFSLFGGDAKMPRVFSQALGRVCSIVPFIPLLFPISYMFCIDLVSEHPILSKPLQICPSINSHHTPQTPTTTRSAHPNRKKKSSCFPPPKTHPPHHWKKHLLPPRKHLNYQQLRTPPAKHSTQKSLLLSHDTVKPTTHSMTL